SDIFLHPRGHPLHGQVVRWNWDLFVRCKCAGLRSAMEQAYEKTAEQIDSAPFHTLHTEPRIFEGVKFHRALALRTAGNDRDSGRGVVERLFNRLGHGPRVWSFDATFRVEAANVPDHHFLLRLAGPELLVEPFERNEALDLVQVSLIGTM